MNKAKYLKINNRCTRCGNKLDLTLNTPEKVYSTCKKCRDYSINRYTNKIIEK